MTDTAFQYGAFQWGAFQQRPIGGGAGHKRREYVTRDSDAIRAAAKALQALESRKEAPKARRAVKRAIETLRETEALAPIQATLERAQETIQRFEKAADDARKRQNAIIELQVIVNILTLAAEMADDEDAIIAILMG